MLNKTWNSAVGLPNSKENFLLAQLGGYIEFGSGCRILKGTPAKPLRLNSIDKSSGSATRYLPEPAEIRGSSLISSLPVLAEPEGAVAAPSSPSGSSSSPLKNHTCFIFFFSALQLPISLWMPPFIADLNRLPDAQVVEDSSTLALRCNALNDLSGPLILFEQIFVSCRCRWSFLSLLPEAPSCPSIQLEASSPASLISCDAFKADKWRNSK